MILTSADGTSIDCVTTGSGPGVLVIPGALTVAEDFEELAAAMSSYLTVHIMERRGRGASGPQDDGYSMATEVEDVGAVLNASEASYVFGHSYGGLIALEAARKSPTIKKVAVYEPGVSINGSIRTAWMTKYKGRLAAGDRLGAFVSFVKGAGPEMAAKNSDWSMRLIMGLVLRGAERNKVFELLPSNLIEHEQVAALDGTFENYREIEAQALLMFGGKSLKSAAPTAEQLVGVLPNASLHRFPKLDHFGPEKKWSADVAERLVAFFKS